MPKPRSATSTQGRNMQVHALWRATGMKEMTLANRLLRW